jgi:hypothetical protein
MQNRRPRLEQGEDVLVVVVGAQDKHRRPRLNQLYLPRSFDAVQLGHGDIHNNYVGFEIVGFLYRFLSIARFPHHLYPLLRLQQPADTLPCDDVVLSKKNANSAHKVITSN